MRPWNTGAKSVGKMNNEAGMRQFPVRKDDPMADGSAIKTKRWLVFDHHEVKGCMTPYGVSKCTYSMA